jgi:hypothetical protein
MQNISSYSTNDSFIRVLLQGPPGSGKTTHACQFPGVYVADLDLNLGGPLRYLKEHNKTLPVGYDVIDRDETGKEVDPKFRYIRLAKCLQEAVANPEVKTIVVDSATKLSDYMIAEVLRQQNAQAMTIQHWGFYLALWKQFISQLSVQKKNFILVCHERVEKDEVDQSLKYFVMVPGQMGNIIGSLFTDVWRAEVNEKAGIPPTYQFLVRTMPSYRFNLKNSLGLPPVFEFDWKVIEEKLK